MDLELENAFQSKISFNIGTLFLYSHANETLAHMFDAWSRAVQEDLEFGSARKKSPRFGQRSKLAPWDQKPINELVIQRGIREHPEDPLLALSFGERLAMGVLPMLQFTTSFTYHVHRTRREHLGVAPYSLHAIFNLGVSKSIKKWVLREEGGWHDEPAYYRGRFMTYEPTPPPRELLRSGGFELITRQLHEFQRALRLSVMLNRTLVAPRLRCGDRSMAYPCYGWYHRAMGVHGLSKDKVPMPEVCPLYYWMDSKALEELPELQLREPGFLMNPRVPEELVRSAATLSFCPNDGSCLPSKTKPGVVSEHVFFSRASAAPRRRAKVAAAALATGPRFSTNASWKDIQVRISSSFEEILHVSPDGTECARTQTTEHPTHRAPLCFGPPHCFGPGRRVSTARISSLDTAVRRGQPGSCYCSREHTPLLASQVVRGDFESISVLHVHNVDLFNPSERRLPPNVPSMETLHRLTSKDWCNGCPITRRGAMINTLNRSVVHELEQFCRTEVGQSSSHFPPPPIQIQMALCPAWKFVRGAYCLDRVS